MKWTTITLMMVWMTCGMITLCDQCSTTEDVFTTPQNPFYDIYQGGEAEGGGGAFVGVNVTHPVNGTTYYTSTLWLNTTIYGDGTPPYTCWYRTSGGWNTYNCENQSVTFPNGEVLVEVWAIDSGGNNGHGYALFYVYESVTGGLVDEFLFAVLFLFVILFSVMFFGLGKRKKRRKEDDEY